MKKTAFIFLVILSVGLTFPSRAAIREGLVLSGVDGELIGPDNNGKWSFRPNRPITDGTETLQESTALELLASASLEKLIKTAEETKNRSYRLWGRVTACSGKNYIFPVYFLPLSDVKPGRQEQQRAEPGINDPDDDFKIPQKIIDRLKNRPIARPEQLKSGLKLKQDFIIADKTGFFAEEKDGSPVFRLNFIGRNIQQISFELLPCETLQRALEDQYQGLDVSRFKVAGILTEYKGQRFLLLERAVKVHGYGNLGR